MKCYLQKMIVSTHLWSISFLLYAGKKLITNPQNRVSCCSYTKFSRLSSGKSLNNWPLKYPSLPTPSTKNPWNNCSIYIVSVKVRKYFFPIPVYLMESSNSQQCCQNKTAPCKQPGQIPLFASLCMGQLGCEGGAGVAREYCCPDRLEDETSVLVHSWKKKGQGQPGVGSGGSDARKSNEGPHDHAGDEREHDSLYTTKQARGQGGQSAVHILRVDWKEKWVTYGTFRREPSDLSISSL